jgi:fluoroacetyl-CoA thioesterase
MGPSVGLRGESTVRVTEARTAQALGSGDLPVLGTPALVALMEAAAVQALSGSLAEGETTVGTRIEVPHLAATPMGSGVRAEAFLIGVEGRKLTFRVNAYDDRQKIGEGTHQRAIVTRSRFLAKLAEQAQPAVKISSAFSSLPPHRRHR